MADKRVIINGAKIVIKSVVFGLTAHGIAKVTKLYTLACPPQIYLYNLFIFSCKKMLRLISPMYIFIQEYNKQLRMGHIR